jgi:hypothetical protein
MEIVLAQMCYQITFAEIAKGEQCPDQECCYTVFNSKLWEYDWQCPKVSYAVICCVAFKIALINKITLKQTILMENTIMLSALFSYGATKIGEVT